MSHNNNTQVFSFEENNTQVLFMSVMQIKAIRLGTL